MPRKCKKLFHAKSARRGLAAKCVLLGTTSTTKLHDLCWTIDSSCPADPNDLLPTKLRYMWPMLPTATKEKCEYVSCCPSFLWLHFLLRVDPAIFWDGVWGLYYTSVARRTEFYYKCYKLCNIANWYSISVRAKAILLAEHLECDAVDLTRRSLVIKY